MAANDTASSNIFTNISGGSEGCRCTDVTDVLSSLTERSCRTPHGEDGVMLAVDGPCVPRTYGSTTCAQHDLVHDPKCSPENSGRSDYPTYCIRPWCYVGAKACMRSDEQLSRSAHFHDLYYSYTTCGSSPDDWIFFQWQHALALGGAGIVTVLPGYLNPYHYKRDSRGDILAAPGNEYYNDSVPFEGVLLNYMDALQQTSKRDFNVPYTFGSKGSRHLHNKSAFTAAVQDVHEGLADMALGPFWVTGERLKMVSFTVPIGFDKQVLVIKNPAIRDSFRAQTSKVFDPFAAGVWVLILVIITLTALLSVWFSNRALMAEKRLRGSTRQLRHPERRKKLVYARLALDEFLTKGMFFCSAGVEQDEGDSLPKKLLLFGFSFFILIVVSAYVANLAAFLTRNSSDYVGTVEQVVKEGLRVCAHTALEADLKMAHPKARFVFSQSGKEFYGMLSDYDAGECDVMAVGEIDTKNDLELMNMFCERNLTFTQSVFIENLVAFPIKSELGQKVNGITLSAKQEEYDIKYNRRTECDVDFHAEGLESSDLAQIRVENLLAPIMFFGAFAVAAIILQIIFHWFMKKGNPQASLIDRRSFMIHGSYRQRPPKRSICFAVDKSDTSRDVDVQAPQASQAQKQRASSPAIMQVESECVMSNAFHDNSLEQSVRRRVSFGKSEDNTRLDLQMLVETGALDDILNLVQKIKERGKGPSLEQPQTRCS